MSDSLEPKSESIETPRRIGGAGAIFYIQDEDAFMFFLRDKAEDKPTIPYPGMIDIIGGHMNNGETAYQTALREFGEELFDATTDEPFQPEGLSEQTFRTYIDPRGVEQNIFGFVFKTRPNLVIKEGQGLVFVPRDQLAETEFAYNYQDVILEYAATVSPQPEK